VLLFLGEWTGWKILAPNKRTPNQFLPNHLTSKIFQPPLTSQSERPKWVPALKGEIFTKTLPKCPYCEQKITYREAWALRKRDEYKCTSCERVLAAELNLRIYRIAAWSGSISFILTVVFLVLIRNCSIWPILCSMFPFFAFYVSSPFFVDLKEEKTDYSLEAV
jgi:hypothetical protein